MANWSSSQDRPKTLRPVKLSVLAKVIGGKDSRGSLFMVRPRLKNAYEFFPV